MPFFRVHCTKYAPRQEPWSFGPRVLELSRLVLRRRYRLLPLLYRLALEAHCDGLPLVRPLFMHCDDVPPGVGDDQFLLGPDLLAAPVLAPGVRRRQVWLPPGSWIDWHDGTGLPVTERSTSTRLCSAGRRYSCVRRGALHHRAGSKCGGDAGRSAGTRGLQAGRWHGRPRPAVPVRRRDRRWSAIPARRRRRARWRAPAIAIRLHAGDLPAGAGLDRAAGCRPLHVRSGRRCTSRARPASARERGPPAHGPRRGPSTHRARNRHRVKKGPSRGGPN